MPYGCAIALRVIMFKYHVMGANKVFLCTTCHFSWITNSDKNISKEMVIWGACCLLCLWVVEIVFVWCLWWRGQSNISGFGSKADGSCTRRESQNAKRQVLCSWRHLRVCTWFNLPGFLLASLHLSPQKNRKTGTLVFAFSMNFLSS